MPLRSKKRSAVPLDNDGPQPGAYAVQGRAHGQVPVWARILSIRRDRRTSRLRHEAWSSQRMSTSDAQEGPEMTSLSSRSPLELVPIPDTPLDVPRERTLSNEPWRNDVDFPSQEESSSSASAQRRSSNAGSDETTDYSLPPELRRGRPTQSSSSTESDPPPDTPLPNPPSFSYIPPELRPSQGVTGDEDDATSSRDDELMESDSDFELNELRQKCRRRNDFLLFLVAVLFGVCIGLAVGIPVRNNKNESETLDGSDESSKCNYSRNSTVIPNAFIQCECDGMITMWTDDVESQYYGLRESFMPTILPNFDEPAESCIATNSALWQLSSDTLFGVDATDNRYLLTLLYANWDGEGWRSKNDWLSTTVSECEWEGISCNNNGQTSTLSLEANNLGGTMPSELGLMTALRVIDLETNRLTGTLPVELFQLRRLERLQLAVNFLNGTIASEFALLPFLSLMQLDINVFSGTIPRELGSMVSLEYLGVGDNTLTGTVPPELGQLLGLESLRFDQNALTGTLPAELGRLGRLRSLAAGSNFFRGRLISEIGNLSELRCLDVGEAGLAGEIPSELGRNTNLSMLILAKNNFVGTLPVQLNNLTDLSNVFFSGNGLSGTIPSEIGTWSSLRILELDDNFFSKTIPSDFGSLSLLASLNLGGLGLSGTAPQEVCDLRNGVLDVFIAPCTESGVTSTTFQCSVPDCCTECVT